MLVALAMEQSVGSAPESSSGAGRLEMGAFPVPDLLFKDGAELDSGGLEPDLAR